MRACANTLQPGRACAMLFQPSRPRTGKVSSIQKAIISITPGQEGDAG